MHLRHVKLEDYENRLKMLVTPEKGKASVVKLKQLKEAFKGNHYLTKILEKGQNGERSLDWKLMMTPGLFVQPQSSGGGIIFEDDPELTFKVNELMLLGILYCCATPMKKTKKFYSLLQSGLDSQIAASDKDTEHYLPLLGRICYIEMISLYNNE